VRSNAIDPGHHARQQPLLTGMTTHIPWTPADPDLLDQAEVARRLTVSRTTIWRLVRGGEIRVVRIGSRTLMPRTGLQRLIHDGTRGEQ
jgi:excisionase family DNA binding protein